MIFNEQISRESSFHPLALLTYLDQGNSYEMINECRSGLTRGRCVCLPKARAVASSDVGAYGTSASPTAGLSSLFLSVDISLE